MSEDQLKVILRSSQYTRDEKVEILIKNCLALSISVCAGVCAVTETMLSESFYALVMSAQDVDLESDTVIPFICRSIRGRLFNYFKKSGKYREKYNESTSDSLSEKQVTSEEIFGSVHAEDFLNYIKESMTPYECKISDYRINGWTLQEIGDELGVTKSAVSHTLVNLRKRLEPKCKKYF